MFEITFRNLVLFSSNSRESYLSRALRDQNLKMKFCTTQEKHKSPAMSKSQNLPKKFDKIDRFWFWNTVNKDVNTSKKLKNVKHHYFCRNDSIQRPKYKFHSTFGRVKSHSPPKKYPFPPKYIFFRKNLSTREATAPHHWLRAYRVDLIINLFFHTSGANAWKTKTKWQYFPKTKNYVICFPQILRRGGGWGVGWGTTWK